MRKSKLIILLALLGVAFLIVYTQITIFVIPPIGSLPTGKTIIIWRLKETDFIDSPAAMCARSKGKVSLLCRGMMMAKVTGKSKRLMKLPYNKILYLISTGGKNYGK